MEKDAHSFLDRIPYIDLDLLSFFQVEFIWLVLTLESWNENKTKQLCDLSIIPRWKIQ